MHTYIKTINQLRKHIGEIVVSYYYHGSMDSPGEGWNPDKDDDVEFMWMFKLVDDGENYKRNSPKESIRYKTIMGINHICLVNNTSFRYLDVSNETPHIMYPSYTGKFDLINPQESSAQTYMRLATKDEIKIFNKLTRKRRILGHD